MCNALYAKVASLKCTRHIQWVASGGFGVMQWRRVDESGLRLDEAYLQSKY